MIGWTDSAKTQFETTFDASKIIFDEEKASWGIIKPWLSNSGGLPASWITNDQLLTSREINMFSNSL